MNAPSLDRLDIYLAEKMALPDYQPNADVSVAHLGVFVRKTFDRDGSFYGILSRLSFIRGVSYMQVNNHFRQTICVYNLSGCVLRHRLRRIEKKTLRPLHYRWNAIDEA